MEDIAKAAKGDAEAIDRLRDSMLEDIVLHMEVDGDLQGEELLSRVKGLQDELDAMGNLQVGSEILDLAGEDDFIDSLNRLIEESGMTADQVNAMLSGMGFEATFATEPQPVTKTGHSTITSTRVIDEQEYNTPDGGTIKVPSTETFTTAGQAYQYTDYVDAVAMTTDGSAPKISKITKKAGGSMNDKSSSNKGGSGKKGKGGGGSKQKSKDYVDPKTDRYHDVNVALKDINTQMEILNKNRENLTGKELADSYREELDLLDKQINALSHKQKLQKEEQQELRSKGRDISRDGKQVHIQSLEEQGVKFDENGNISNYNEAIVNKTNEYNSQIEKYNKGQLTEEQITELEKNYQQFLDDIARYETLTQDELTQTAKEIADALNKKIELKIEKFSMTIDLKINTREAENRLEDFNDKLERRNKTAVGRTQTAANKFANYMDKDTGIQAEVDRVNKIKDDIKKMQNGEHSDVYSEYDEESGTWVDNMAKAQEDLAKYTEQMMADMEDVEDLMDAINQGLLDTFDEIQESFDDQIAGYDAVADQIEHNISLIEKLYGDETADKLGQWYDAQYENSVGKVDMLKKEADFWQTQMENAENDDAYKKAKENWLKSMSELNSAVEDSLDTIIASYENSIDQIFDKLNRSLTGGTSLDYMGEEWELINANADRYLDTINATYEVQKTSI